MTWKLNRFLHSPKKAGYFAGFFSMSIMSLYALMGRLIVPSEIQNHTSKGSAVILSGARASPSSLPPFALRH
ncbi:MAG: hypothetical protein KA094_02345 [Methanoregulaceae archaeon]|nr:hypothetical protein [Methanoregulaceae archaeon]